MLDKLRLGRSAPGIARGTTRGRLGKLGALMAGGALLVGATAIPASADPKKGEVTPLTCDNGKNYRVVVNGNGDYTPGHDLDSTAMLIPLAFGPFTGTVTDGEGNVVEEINEPGSSKGQSGKRAKNAVTCSFTFSGTEGGMTFTGSGTVVVRITPQKRA